jgi:hypothetical protein
MLSLGAQRVMLTHPPFSARLRPASARSVYAMNSAIAPDWMSATVVAMSASK